MLVGTNYATTSSVTWIAKVTFSLVWSAKHAIVEGIAFLLMQKGLGIENLINVEHKYIVIYNNNDNNNNNKRK